MTKPASASTLQAPADQPHRNPSLPIYLDLLGALCVVLPSGVSVRLGDGAEVAQLRELLLRQAEAPAGCPPTVGTRSAPTQYELDKVRKFTTRGKPTADALLAELGL